MRSVRRNLSSVLILVGLSVGVGLFGGCAESDLQLKNRMQAEKISSLMSELETARLELDAAKKKLAVLEQSGPVEAESLRQKVASLQKALDEREALIRKMQGQLIGGGPLPVELNTALEDFAKQNPDLIEFDSQRGLVKFKSDLLFDKGSDQVASVAQTAIKQLTGILNSDQAKGFDIIVAGHTDDIPIKRPATVAAHPTNWDLSVDRALAVLKLMETDGIASVRLSARGFSEFRPIEANTPNKGGNAKNRRVEIYIVPKGV